MTRPRVTQGLCGQAGQATVEAAALLPTLMLLVAMLAQPVCVAYTRSVMRGAAAQAARVLTTSDASADDDCRAFVLRRLEAVPEVPLFHVGGRSDWEVSFSRASSAVTVGIAGHLRPLPLFGVVMGALGERDGTGIVVRVEVTERTRPEWLGGDYGSWLKIWG